MAEAVIEGSSQIGRMLSDRRRGNHNCSPVHSFKDIFFFSEASSLYLIGRVFHVFGERGKKAIKAFPVGVGVLPSELVLEGVELRLMEISLHPINITVRLI